MVNTIGSKSVNTFPAWTILLGYGGTSDPSNWYDLHDFYDLKVTDKINQIPAATLSFHNKTKAELTDLNIRIYLDGKKKFSGKIKVITDTVNSKEVSVEAKGLAEYLHEKVIEKIIDIKNTKTSTIITGYLAYPGWSIVFKNDILTDFPVNYRIEKGNFLMHINYLTVLNFLEWWCEGEDSVSSFESRSLVIGSMRGKGIPVATFTLEINAFDLTLNEDKEKVKNVIVVSGSSSQASNLSTTASGFFKPGEFGYLIGGESTLANPVVVGDTSLVLEDSSGYESSGTVKIDDEEFSFTANDGDTTLTIPAATASHDPDSPVLAISLLKAYIPPSISSNRFWLGNELVEASHDYWGLHDLIRGCDYDGSATPIYCHLKGTRIYDGTYSNNSPHQESSIAVYGKNEYRASSIGTTDRDGLDKYGASLIQATQTKVEFGSFFVALDDLNGIEPGDYFNLIKYGESESNKHRCTGIVYGLETAEILFGLNEEYVLQQFDDISRIEDTTYAKDNKAKEVDIISVSADKKSVKVLDASGNEKWVQVV